MKFDYVCCFFLNFTMSIICNSCLLYTYIASYTIGILILGKSITSRILLCRLHERRYHMYKHMSTLYLL